MRGCLLGIALAGGCFDPTYTATLLCGDGMACPTGATCVLGVCDASECRRDDECPSKVCLPDRTCAAPGTVREVSPATIDGAFGPIGASVVHLEPSEYDVMAPLLIERDVTVIARGARLKANDLEAIFKVTGRHAFTLVGGTYDSSNTTADLTVNVDRAVLCEVAGAKVRVVEATITRMEFEAVKASRCDLEITRSQLLRTATAIHVRGEPTARIDVRVVGNHLRDLSIAGIDVLDANGRIVHNTFVSSAESALICDGARVDVDQRGNLFADSPTPGNACADAGAGTVSIDSILETGHLKQPAPPSLIDAIDCPPGDRDLDGQPRPLGAACDMGADEILPP